MFTMKCTRTECPNYSGGACLYSDESLRNIQKVTGVEPGTAECETAEGESALHEAEGRA